MDAPRPLLSESAAYIAVSNAIWAALPSWRSYVIAIDGRDGVGKSSLARYLAWQLGISALELDTFRDLQRTPFDFRYDDLCRAMDARLARNRPVIVEGVTVLQVLDRLSRQADYVVFVEHDDPVLDAPAEQLIHYLQQYKPYSRAHHRVKW